MLRLVLSSFLTALLLMSCDTSINPAREETFSVYGYLDLNAEKQFVRVKPLDRRAEGGDGGRLEGVTVTLENKDDGKRYTLQDSIVAFVDDGDTVFTHNYWTDAEIEPQTEYELSVRREGEVVTSTSARTPTNSTPSVRPDSGNCLTTFTVQFEDSNRLPIRLFGTFEYNGTTQRVSLKKDSITSAQNPSGTPPFIVVEPENDILASRIPMKDQPDTGGMFDDRYVPRCLNLDDTTIEMRYTLSQDWEVGLPDSSMLSGPIQFIENPDVKNGSGFFGALGGGSLSVRVDTADTLGSQGPPM